ncbi:MAG TPA: ribosome maturation factor RimM [Steroidobacteraceae bacterium]|nr:ribosome maturation factor RimM [Steroidobacteraceae bacterium]
MGEEAAPLVVLGAITAPFGVKGWVKLRSDTDPPERLFDYPNLCLRQRGATAACRVEQAGRSAGRLTAKFAGIDDRNRAAGLAGAEVCVTRSELPARAPGEYYRADLIGLRVVDLTGAELGIVEHFVETPAHALMVVRGAKNLWVPAVPRHLRRVDLRGRLIVVDWQEPAD